MTNKITREEAIQELQNCKGLIQQDGQDYLDERDIPLLDMAIEALTEKNIARDIATILENEQDMRAILQNGELVRCKDCRHSDTTGVYVEDVVYCKWLHTSCVKNGYCHRGERKGGDTE